MEFPPRIAGWKSWRLEQEIQREIVLEAAEKEQWDEVFKTKDRRGATKEMVRIPAISAENHGRLQEATV